MSERKVLNKYYPPDFDPSKIPRMKLAKNRQYTVRLMAPFNMRCVTCGEYIYKGKKFNARKEDVENEDYLGIRIYRFYIKCTRCLQEISFKTDPKNTDYEIEAGATRNFMALKLAEEQAKREDDEQKEEEANNPMKLLEYRTEQSRQEIDLLESLEELKELNRRQCTIDYEDMLKQYLPETTEERKAREEKEDNEFINSVKFENTSSKKFIAEEIIEEIVEDSETPAKKIKMDTGIVSRKPEESLTTKKDPWKWNSRNGLRIPNNLVKIKNNHSKTEKSLSIGPSAKPESSATENASSTAVTTNASIKDVAKPAAMGLSLLAAYSGSDSDSQ